MDEAYLSHKDQYYKWLVRNNRKPDFAMRVVNEELPYVLSLLNYELTKEAVDNLIFDQLEKGNAESYANRLVDFLKVYCQFLKEINYAFEERILETKRLEETKPLRSIFTIEEIKQFLSIEPCKNTNLFRHSMWNMFWAIVVFSGLRVGEVANLTRPTILISQQLFYIDGKTNKTGRSRYMAMSPALLEPLKKYLQYQVKGDILFRSIKNKNSPFVTCSSWEEDFKMRLRKTGINKQPRPRPYDLRHSFATRNLEENENMLFTIQQALGHSKLETTKIYFDYSTKHLHRLVENDPLAREFLEESDRAKQFKEKVRKLADSYGYEEKAFSINEEGIMFEYK